MPSLGFWRRSARRLPALDGLAGLLPATIHRRHDDHAGIAYLLGVPGGESACAAALIAAVEDS